MKYTYAHGATPLDLDEAAGLKLTHITTLKELNVFEQQNIQQALIWAFKGKRVDMLDESFICNLHQHMFSKVWKWAGKYRTSNKNIGVMYESIGVDLRNLIDDTKFWLQHETFNPDELAARFHHRMVSIHPFPNGNGRHARLIADLLLEKHLDRPRFSWGSTSLEDQGATRTLYIDALRSADQNDYTKLLTFVRS